MFDYKATVDRLLQKTVEEGEAVGLSLLVLHREKEIYYNAFGYADRERAIPMGRDTICRLFSMTKPVTAVAVMILAERGELDLLDPVSRYLPWYHNQQVWLPNGRTAPAVRDSTIWDMLHMLSGIPYPDQNHEPGRRMEQLFSRLIEKRKRGERVDTMEYLRGIAEVPLCFQPGTKWMYGLSADVLGGVVQAVSGLSYGQFLKKELFDPLGMKDTGFFVPEEKRDRFARNYIWNEEKGLLEPFTGCHLGEYYGVDVAFESGGAGLVSTLDDYSSFARMLLHKGRAGESVLSTAGNKPARADAGCKNAGGRILGRKTVEFMTQNRLSETQKADFNWDSLTGYGYGCLMRVMTDQGRLVGNASPGEFGWDGWTGNYVTIDPSEELIMIFMLQRCAAQTTPLLRRLRMATYAYLE